MMGARNGKRVFDGCSNVIDGGAFDGFSENTA